MRLACIPFLLISLVSCQHHPFTGSPVYGEIVLGGMNREHIFFAPEDLGNDSPLLMVLHGYSGSAESIMDYSGLNDLSLEHQFAVVYPQGSMDADSNQFWHVGYTFHEDMHVDDLDYLVSLIRHLQKKYRLSRRKVFVSGMSNGGEMAYLLALKHPDVFLAAAPVAGMMLYSFFEDRQDSHPYSLFAIFGTGDPVTRFEGDPDNEDGWGAYMDIPATIGYWANRLDHPVRMLDTLPDTQVTDSSFIVRERYLGKVPGKEVLFYRVENGGHEWPGAWGNMDISASHEIWAFFERCLELQAK